MSCRVLVVDGANVVGSRPDGWWRDRAGAARRLADDLAGLAAATAPPARVVLVLEGAARVGVPPGRHPDPEAALEVVHAPASGDDEIVRQVGLAAVGSPGGVEVVTADRALRARVQALGATVLGPAALRRLLSP